MLGARPQSPSRAAELLVLIENPQAEIVPLSFGRIVARYGHLAAIREAMLVRDDVPAPTRQALVAKLSETLAEFVASREWLAQDRAQRVAEEDLREGHGHARRRLARQRDQAAHPPFARERPA